MPFSSDAIANAFLAKAESNDELLTPMKLQKLAYFAHGWFLAIESKPFVNEPIQAWKYGPVIQSLYHEFKEFGNSGIDRRAQDTRYIEGQLRICNPVFEDEKEKSDISVEFGNAVVEKMWEMYGGHTAVELSNATHAKGTPWRQIYDRFNGNIPMGITTSSDLIEAYFKERLISASEVSEA